MVGVIGTSLRAGIGAFASALVRLRPALRKERCCAWLTAARRAFMQRLKWLGHSSFTLALDVYGDFAPELRAESLQCV
jgi:hypothetical protein